MEECNSGLDATLYWIKCFKPNALADVTHGLHIGHRPNVNRSRLLRVFQMALHLKSQSGQHASCFLAIPSNPSIRPIINRSIKKPYMTKDAFLQRIERLHTGVLLWFSMSHIHNLRWQQENNTTGCFKGEIKKTKQNKTPHKADLALQWGTVKR